MGLFKRKQKVSGYNGGVIASGIEFVEPTERDQAAEMAMTALKSIHEGVMMMDGRGIIRYMNPAGMTLTGFRPEEVIGAEAWRIVLLADKNGQSISPEESPIQAALHQNEIIQDRTLMLVSAGDKRTPIALVISPTEGMHGYKIVTFRDITRELAEENEQAEFVSTASHEMRTPVASIEGFLGLAMNPQTATIDDRARKYLTQAHESSQHLGKLFQDLLDTTKLSDGRMKPKMRATDISTVVKQIADGYQHKCEEKGLKYGFGAGGKGQRVEQILYSNVDVNFLSEIMANYIENAIKYTKAGGSVWVNLLGDGDRVLINVTDSGIGISQDDLAHVFQKFYRADNSDTRTIGGTGLGLYIVKLRAVSMGGKVWAESILGEGSTFYLSLPRLTPDEYEKRRVAEQSQDMIESIAARTTNVMAQPVVPNGQQMAVPVMPAGMVNAPTAPQVMAPGVPGAPSVPIAPTAPPGQMRQNPPIQNPNNNI